MATDTFYDSDYDCPQDMFLNEKNMQEAEPVICWGRGLPKPKFSEIPMYKILSRFVFTEKTISKRPSGRGRGTSYKSKFLNDRIVGERILTETNVEEIPDASSVYLQQYEHSNEKDHLSNNHDLYQSDDLSVSNANNHLDSATDNSSGSSKSTGRSSSTGNESVSSVNSSSAYFEQLENGNVCHSPYNCDPCQGDDLQKNNSSNYVDNSAKNSASSSTKSSSNENISLETSSTVVFGQQGNDNLSNNCGPYQGDDLPENIASNYLDIDVKNLTRSSKSSSSSYENISAVNCSSLFCQPNENDSLSRNSKSRDSCQVDFSSLPNSSASSFVDIATGTKNATTGRSSSKSRSSSNEFISSMDCGSKSSEQEGIAAPNNSDRILADNSLLSDSSATGSGGLTKEVKAVSGNLNIKGGRTVHKKTKARKYQHFTKMNENRKHACAGKAETNAGCSNKERKDTCVDNANTNAGCSNMKKYSPSKMSMYKKKEIFKECNDRNIRYPGQSGSESSSEESLCHGHNDWGSINFNKPPSNRNACIGNLKQKWEDGDFPSLGSTTCSLSTSASKFPQKKESPVLNLKSVGESLLQPLSNSCTGSSSDRDSPVPDFIGYLATSDKSCFTIRFAVENIPGFIEEQSVRDLLEAYGEIVALQLNSYNGGDFLTAHVTMKSQTELKEIIGHLNDTSPFGASSQNLKVYLLHA